MPVLVIFGRIIAADVVFYFRDKPTVALVVIDALRSDHVGVYGYGRDTTPAIDHFASSDGTVFLRAVAQAPWTKPSVASLFTSTLPSEHTVKTIWSDLPGEAETIAEVLKMEGYATICVSGNPHVGRSMVQGFDYFYDLTYSTELEVVIKGFFGGKYGGLFGGALYFFDIDASRTVEDADIATAVATNALRRFSGRPVFLYVHYIDPYTPYEAPPPWGWTFGPPVMGEEPRATNALRVGVARKKLKDRDYVLPLTEEEVLRTRQALRLRNTFLRPLRRRLD